MLSRNTLAPIRLLICCGCLFAVAGPGCEKSGPKMYPVQGKVTYAGKPVPRGTVTFYPDKKKGNDSMELPIGAIEEGQYHLVTRTIDGATPGWYNAAVNAAEQIDLKNPYFTKWLVPPKYGDPKTAKLPFQVVENAAPGAYDIHLESK